MTISYGINVFIGMVLEFGHVGLTDRFHLRRLGSYHIGLLLLPNLESHHSQGRELCTSSTCCDRALCGHQLVCLREEAVQGATSGIRPIQTWKGCGIRTRGVQFLRPGQYRRHGNVGVKHS